MEKKQSPGTFFGRIPQKFRMGLAMAAGIAVTIGILVFIIIPTMISLDFQIGSSLVVLISPLTTTTDLVYGQNATINFTVSARQYITCSAQCSYTFIDQSRNAVIDTGNFTLKHSGALIKNYSITIDKIGSGQDIYNFLVACQSTPTTFCPVQNEKPRLASSLVVVNYDLSDELKVMKTDIGRMLSLYLAALDDMDIFAQNLSSQIFEIGFKTDTKSLQHHKDIITTQLDALRIKSLEYHTLWSQEAYPQLFGIRENITVLHLKPLQQEIKNLDEEFVTLVAAHNALLDDITRLSEVLEQQKSRTVLFIPDELAYDDFDYFAMLNASVIQLNAFADMLRNNSFESISALQNQLDRVTLGVLEKDKESMQRAVHELLRGQLALRSELDYACALQENCTYNASLVTFFNETELLLKSHGTASIIPLKATCSTFLIIPKELNQSEVGSALPQNPEFFSYASRKREYLRNQIQNSYRVQLLTARLPKNSSLYSIYPPENLKTEIDSLLDIRWIPFTLNQSLEQNATLFLRTQLNFSNDTKRFMSTVCPLLEAQVPIENSNISGLMAIARNDSLTVQSRITTRLSEHAPQCCVFGQCNPCCTIPACADDPQTYPIIFLHGHAVRRSNSPDFSLDTFDQIQYAFEKDGYLNGGVLLYAQGDVPDGAWGKSGRPITVKTTYYYDIYRNKEQYQTVPAASESIDTYALRVKDIVDVVKARTGKKKVTLVAFSMGGLVARKYAQIYGGESIHKLITIGTPHRGVTGDVRGLCPVLGQNKECRDLQKDSIFLNRLNDPARQPKNVSMYAIIGSGCPTQGTDGDGIVTVESGSLRGIIPAQEYIVNGSCSGAFGQFHTALVNINEYPGVYRYLKEILKEEDARNE